MENRMQLWTSSLDQCAFNMYVFNAWEWKHRQHVEQVRGHGVHRGGGVTHGFREFVAPWWPEGSDAQCEQRARDRESGAHTHTYTELRACRLLLLRLTVGSAVDLSDCHTPAQRACFSRDRSL